MRINAQDRRFSFQLPPRLYDKLRKEAFKQEKSIGETIRRILMGSLTRKKEEEASK